MRLKISKVPEAKDKLRIRSPQGLLANRVDLLPGSNDENPELPHLHFKITNRRSA